MEQSKLIRIFRTFSLIEFKAFQKMILSPYYNSRSDLEIMTKAIGDTIRSGENFPEKEPFFRSIFPGQVFQETQANLLMSYLLKLVRKFLITRDIEGNSYTAELSYLKSLRTRGLLKDFEQECNKMQTRLINSDHRNEDYLEAKYRLYWQVHQFRSTKEPYDEQHLIDTTNALDQLYLTQKLRHNCLLLAHSSVYQSDYQSIFLNALLKYAESQEWFQSPGLAMYYSCYKMLKDGAPVDFQNFKTALFKFGFRFPNPEIRDLFLLAINYCVRQSNSGEKEYLSELLQLYQEGLEKGYLLEDRTLSRFTYHNVVGLALKLNEVKWARYVIETYRDNLDEGYRTASYNFNRARLAYHQKDYQEVLDLLQNARHRNPLLSLASKTLLLKTYYETDEFDLLESHLDAMKSYLSRRHDLGYHKKRYRTLIKITKSMINLNLEDKEEVNSLVSKIRETKFIVEKEWFLRCLVYIKK